MRYLYTFLLSLLAPFYLFSLYRTKAGKPRIGKRWKEHFGITPRLRESHPIWIHAVSVGEVIAVKPFIYALLETYPDQSILLTTTTATGAEIANQIDERVEHRYMPLDFSFAVKRFLKTTQPKILLIMETELWPNTLHTVSHANIPVLVLNARLSERSMKRYKKVSSFFSQVTDNIAHIFSQFDADSDRFNQLGVKKEKLSVTGSMKFDLPEISASVWEKTCLDTSPFIWAAASTHQGEDEILLSAHKLLLKQLPHARLILIPRHPERFDDVATLIEHEELMLARRSKQASLDTACQVYLGDSLGEMLTLITPAKVVFMGGSLLGKKVGGHNLLEPAALSKPQLMGESYYNFQVIGDALIASGACQICQTPEAIAAALEKYFHNPALVQLHGKAGLEIVNQNRGAIKNTLKTLTYWLG